MSAQQVTQNTFDAIVREAMTDFGLSASEAVIEAREQLSKAGITDFSNLIDPTSAGTDEYLSDYAIISSRIDTALESNSPKDLVLALEKLASADQKASAVAGGNGAVEAVVRALAHGVGEVDKPDLSSITASCEAITTLCSQNETNRTRFARLMDPDGIEQLVMLIRRLSTDVDSQANALQRALAAIVAVQRQCEGVKRRVAAGETPDTILDLVAQSVAHISEGKVWVDLFATACCVLRQLLSADDVSVTVAETFVRARLLAGAKVVTESGLRSLQGTKTLVDLIGDMVALSEVPTGVGRTRVLLEYMSVAKLVAVSDEICKDIADRGVGKLAIALLDETKGVGALKLACLGLLRNLAGRDACKSDVLAGMDVIQQSVQLHFRESSAIAQVFCGLVSRLCLRRGDIGREFVENGVMRIVLDAMDHHGECVGVTKAGCIAIRNAVSKDENARCTLVSNGRAEAAVRRAWRKFPGPCDDVAYCALQELDVLDEKEMRRDERYTMPDGFYQRTIIRKG